MSNTDNDGAQLSQLGWGVTVLSILLERTFRQNQFSTQKEDWVENPKSMEADSKRKAGGPSQSVMYFQLLVFGPLCQCMLLCWKAPIMMPA